MCCRAEGPPHNPARHGPARHWHGIRPPGRARCLDIGASLEACPATAGLDVGALPTRPPPFDIRASSFICDFGLVICHSPAHSPIFRFKSQYQIYIPKRPDSGGLVLAPPAQKRVIVRGPRSRRTPVFCCSPPAAISFVVFRRKPLRSSAYPPVIEP